MTTLEPTRDLRASAVAEPIHATSEHAGSPDAEALAADALAADSLATRIARVERTSGILWMAVGAVQIVTLFLAVAGIWNFFAGFSRLRSASRIQHRQASVPSVLRQVLGLVLIVLINVAFGVWWAVAIVGLDIYVRYQVQRNRAIFTR